LRPIPRGWERVKSGDQFYLPPSKPKKSAVAAKQSRPKLRPWKTKMEGGEWSKKQKKRVVSERKDLSRPGEIKEKVTVK